MVVVDASFSKDTRNHKILVKNKQGMIYMCPPVPAEYWRSLIDKVGPDLNSLWILIEKENL